jgi:hypothetical protein
VSKIQAWREVRSKWSTANIALRELETAILNFRWSYPSKDLLDDYDHLNIALTGLLRASREVGELTRDIRDGILAEEGEA